MTNTVVILTSMMTTKCCLYLYKELVVLRREFSRCCGKSTIRTSSLHTRSVLLIRSVTTPCYSYGF